MKQLRLLFTAICLLSALAFSANANVTGSIVPLNIKHNVILNGEKCLEAHYKVNINGIKGKKFRVAIYIEHPKGTGLRDTNGRYNTVDGCVATHIDEVSPYDNTVYKDFRISIPNNELHPLPGKRTYYIVALIWYGNTVVARSDYMSYTMEGASNNGHNQNHANNNSNYINCSYCKGSGNCGGCSGTGSSGVYNSWTRSTMPCMLCMGNGKCIKCKGAGRMTKRDSQMYDQQQQIRMQSERESRRNGSSGSSSGSSGSSSGSSRGSSSSTCSYCGGTGVNPNWQDEGKTHSSSLMAWWAWFNKEGDKCPYCGRYTMHHHSKCPRCNVPR